MKIYSHFFHLIENLHYLCRSMEKKETIPSYKRRLNDWDYSQPRIYSQTICTSCFTLPARCPSIWARWWQALRLVATRNGGRCREAPSGKTPSEEKPRGKTTGHQTKFRENPRRSLIKRQHADWFRPFTITAAGTTLHAYGNLELLRAPRRQAVRISSRITAEECNRQQQELLVAARLLFLTPYPYSTQKVVLTRSVCNYLNVLAARLC